MEGQADSRPHMRTIGQWQGVFRELFRRAWGGYEHSSAGRWAGGFIDLLMIGNFPRVDDSCFAGEHDGLSEPLADCLVDLFVICDRLGIDLDHAIASKWPGVCFYCGKAKDCDCVGRHGGPKLDGSVRTDLLAKSLREWQQMLGGLFGAINQTQGLIAVSEHLGREIHELDEAITAYEASGGDIERFAVMLECADVLAWLIAVANLLDLDLSTELLDTYRFDRCPSCEQDVCKDEANCPLQGWSRHS